MFGVWREVWEVIWGRRESWDEWENRGMWKMWGRCVDVCFGCGEVWEVCLGVGRSVGNV